MTDQYVSNPDNVDAVLERQRRERDAELANLGGDADGDAGTRIASENYNIVGDDVDPTSVDFADIRRYAGQALELRREWANLTPEERAARLAGAAEEAIDTDDPINWSLDSTLASGNAATTDHDISLSEADFTSPTLGVNAVKATIHEPVHVKQSETADGVADGSIDDEGLAGLTAEYVDGAQSSFTNLMEREGTRDGAPSVLHRMYEQLPIEGEAYFTETVAGELFEQGAAVQDARAAHRAYLDAQGDAEDIMAGAFDMFNEDAGGDAAEEGGEQ